jgi:predicted nucleotidyltransferase
MNAQITEKIISYFKDKPVKKVYLFGSYARNEETSESDVDILVDLDPEVRVGGFQFGGMLEDLKDILLKDVDLLTRGSISKYILPYVENDKILIYEK